MAKKSEQPNHGHSGPEGVTGPPSELEAPTGTAVATQHANEHAKSNLPKTVGGDLVVESLAPDEDYESAMKQINAATMENIGVGEVQISRLSIAQPGTPEVASNEQGWQAGMLYDSMSREPISLFGKPPWMLARGIDPGELKAVHYVPMVYMFKLPTEFVKWPSKQEREAGIKQFHWKDLDKFSPRVREGLWKPKGTWIGEKGQAPPVTEHMNLLGFGLDEHCNFKSNLLISSLSRTSYPVGKKLVTALQQHKMNNLPWWGRVYYLFTEPRRDELNNTYYVICFAKGPMLLEYGSVVGGDNSQNKNVFNQCFKMSKSLSDQVHGRALQESMLNAAQITEEASEPSEVVEGDDPTF